MSEFIHVEPVRYWCHKILPLVYDDSLSYMELLNKVVYKLNEVVNNNNELPAYIAEQIKNYINSGEISKVVKDILANYSLNVKFPPEGITPAVGDGTADDTAAFQGCLDYAHAHGGMMVFVPAGKYLCGNLTMYSGCSIKGDGRYNTTIVMRGGVSNPFIGGELDSVQIADISIDGNADIQVNNVDVIDATISNALFTNLKLTDGYTLLKIHANGGSIQLSNIIFDKCVVRGLDILKIKDTKIEANNLVFNEVSALNGESELKIETDNGLYSNIICYATVPNAIEIVGNNNKIEAVIENAVGDYTNTGNYNTITIIGKSNEQHLSGFKNTNVANGITETAESKTVNVSKAISETAESKSVTTSGETMIKADRLFIDTIKPVKYSVPAVLNDYFKSIKMTDKNGVDYDVLVAGENIDKIGSGVAIYSGNSFKEIADLIKAGAGLVVMTSDVTCNELVEVENCAIYGQGHKVTFSGSGRINFLDNTNINGVTFTGETGNIYDVHIGHAGSDAPDIYNIYFRGCKFDGLKQGAVVVGGVNCRFENCEFTKSKGSGLSFVGNTRNTTVISCYFGENVNRGLGFAGGISNNISIIGCRFYKNGNGTSIIDREQLNIHDGHNILIDGCSFDTCIGPSIDLSGNGREIIDIKNVTISNCYFTNQTDANTGAIILFTVDEVNIHDNVIDQNTKGIDAVVVQNTVIKNNRQTGGGTLFFAENTARLTNILIENNNTDGLIIDIGNLYDNWKADNSLITNCRERNNKSTATGLRYKIGDEGGKAFDLDCDVIRLYTKELTALLLPNRTNRTYCKKISVTGGLYTINSLEVNTNSNFTGHEVLKVENVGPTERTTTYECDGFAISDMYVKFNANTETLLEIEFKTL